MDLIKKLTGKNQSDYEQAAAHIINSADSDTFKLLVDKDDFLFDFIKQNVANRLESACNENNYLNLLNFLEFYSPSYDDFIAKVLSKYADESLIDKMYDLLISGSNAQKCYASKFFSYKADERTTEKLIEYAFSDFGFLAVNSAYALSNMKNRKCIDVAYDKMKSDDDFEVLSSVKFLSAYGETEALDKIFDVMKKSSVAEYIACEVGYMADFFELLDSEKYYDNVLLALLNVLQGLGEIVAIGDIFSFRLFDVFEKLLSFEPDSKNSIVLLTAKNKFNLLTENDEYLFDEDKNTKNEVYQIRDLLNDNLDDDLVNFINVELNEDSVFVFFALELAKDKNAVRNLLNSENQTLILKSLEVLKNLNSLIKDDKDFALNRINDENIRNIILAL